MSSSLLWLWLTRPRRHWDSLTAPQHPKKPTSITSAPAAIRMYTPGRKQWRPTLIIDSYTGKLKLPFAVFRHSSRWQCVLTVGLEQKMKMWQDMETSARERRGHTGVRDDVKKLGPQFPHYPLHYLWERWEGRGGEGRGGEEESVHGWSDTLEPPRPSSVPQAAESPDYSRLKIHLAVLCGCASLHYLMEIEAGATWALRHALKESSLGALWTATNEIRCLTIQLANTTKTQQSLHIQQNTNNHHIRGKWGKQKQCFLNHLYWQECNDSFRC